MANNRRTTTEVSWVCHTGQSREANVVTFLKGKAMKSSYRDLVMLVVGFVVGILVGSGILQKYLLEVWMAVS